MTLVTLLGRLLPRDARDELVGDIQEMYARDRARVGRVRAARHAVAELLALAIRARVQSDDPGRYRIAFEEKKRNYMDALARDIRYAFRTLGRTPGFTFVVVLMLALGIGSNAAIFSLLDQLLYRSLPVHDPASLVQFDAPGPFRGRSWGDRAFSYPMYRDLRDQTKVFDGVIARQGMSATLGIDGQSERVQTELVSGNYFEMLGVQPAAGRVFSGADEQTPRAHPVVVLNHGYWQRRFGGDRSVVGRSITVNGHPMTVVGVSAPGFNGVVTAGTFDIAVPVMMKAIITPTWDELENRRSRFLMLMARLKPNTTIDEARAQMNVVYRQINEAELAAMQGGSASFRERFRNKALVIEAGGRGFSANESIQTPLLTMMAMVGLVLLIACANIANLILARSAARKRETAVRLAIGATRGTLVRQQLVESLIMSLAGALAGIGVAAVCGWGLIAMMPGDTATRAISGSPDARVLLFALGLSLVTAVIFGLAPAVGAARATLVTALKDEGGAVMSGRGQMRVRKGLVVAQVALSMLLVAAGGLFARSLQNLRQFDPGFDSDGLITFTVEPALNGYPHARILDTLARVREQSAALPGVTGATMALIPLMTDSAWSTSIRVDGYQAKEGEDMNPHVNAVGNDFFRTMGIQLLAGRQFDDRDRAESPRVAVVNETFAKYFFGNESAIGRRFTAAADTVPTEIIGVARDSKSTGIKDATTRVYYKPLTQEAEVPGASFYVRTSGDTTAPAAGLRSLVRAIDPAVPVFDMMTMEARMSESLFADRLLALLSTAFASLATLLAAIGLYGVMSYAVARRRKEIGVRMALGADAGSVQRMVLREISLMAAIGIAIGLGAAMYLASLISSVFFGMSPLDPIALAGAVLLLTVVILVAGWMPARRASRIEPLRALRSDA